MNMLTGAMPVWLSAEAEMSRIFDLDLQLIADAVLTIIALFFLFIALSYLLFEPARAMLEGRRQKIKSELESAANDMESARTLKEEYEDKIKNIEKEAEKISSALRNKFSYFDASRRNFCVLLH